MYQLKVEMIFVAKVHFMIEEEENLGYHIGSTVYIRTLRLLSALFALVHYLAVYRLIGTIHSISVHASHGEFHVHLLLLPFHSDRFLIEMFQNHGLKEWISLRIMLLRLWLVIMSLFNHEK